MQYSTSVVHIITSKVPTSQSSARLETGALQVQLVSSFTKKNVGALGSTGAGQGPYHAPPPASWILERRKKRKTKAERGGKGKEEGCFYENIGADGSAISML